MTENLSPEEKLLKLIRGPKKPSPARDNQATLPAREEKSRPVYSIFSPLASGKYFSAFFIQKIAYLLLGVSAVYLILCLFYPLLARKPDLTKIKAEKIPTSAMLLPGQARPLEFYLAKTKNKPLFAKSLFSEGQTTGAPVSPVGTEMMKDMNLVGIISGENPQAVIEDKNTQKTYYLSKGQFIGEGQIQIEDIRESKIIVNFKGQRFELYL